MLVSGSSSGFYSIIGQLVHYQQQVTMATSTPSSQAFCFKLNSHQSHMIQAFQRLYNDEVMVDCTLSCAGGTIKAHKVVLSACSPYFTSLFTSFTNPYQYPVIILKDMPFADLKAIIEFMYRGEVTVPQSTLPSVLESAKTLSVTGLCDIKIANLDSLFKNTSGLFLRSRQKRRRNSSNKDASSVEAISSNDDEARANDSNNAIPPSRGRNEHNSNSQTTTESVSERITNLAENDDDNDDIDDTNVHEKHSELDSRPSLSTSHLRTTPKMSPLASMKKELRDNRIQKLQQETGGVSGRKLWTDEEMKTLVRIWDEESARCSAAGRPLALQRICELLQAEKIDRDLSQVEGKVKALKRDYKAVKENNAIAKVHARMIPFMGKLERIFSRGDDYQF